MFLHPEGFLALGSDDALRTAVWHQLGGLGIVLEVGIQNSNETTFQRGLLDGDHQLDTFFQIARHPVCGRDVNPTVAPLMEIEQAGVFEVAVDHGDHFDVFRVF